MKIEDVLEIIWTIVRRLMKGSLILILLSSPLDVHAESGDLEKRVAALEDTVKILIERDETLRAAINQTRKDASNGLGALMDVVDVDRKNVANDKKNLEALMRTILNIKPKGEK